MFQIQTEFNLLTPIAQLAEHLNVKIILSAIVGANPDEGITCYFFWLEPPPNSHENCSILIQLSRGKNHSGGEGNRGKLYFQNEQILFKNQYVRFTS